MEDINKLREFYNCKRIGNFVLDDYYYNLYVNLINDKDICESCDLFDNTFITALNVEGAQNKIKDAINLYDELGVNLHDVNIADISNIRISRLNNNDVYKKSCREGSPKDIPLFLYDDNSLRGPSYSELEVVEIKDDEENKKAFSGISVERNNVRASQSFYNHEIAHTQLLNNQVLDDLLDEEVIPIFFEQITAYHLNPSMFDLIRYIRLSDISEKIKYLIYNVDQNSYDVINSKKYISSTLKAIKLVNYYIHGNKRIRDDILGIISKIFEGQENVDTLLQTYNLDLEHSKHKLKTLKKV